MDGFFFLQPIFLCRGDSALGLFLSIAMFFFIPFHSIFLSFFLFFCCCCCCCVASVNAPHRTAPHSRSLVHNHSLIRSLSIAWFKMPLLPAEQIGSGRWFNDCFWHHAIPLLLHWISKIYIYSIVWVALCTHLTYSIVLYHNISLALSLSSTLFLTLPFDFMRVEVLLLLTRIHRKFVRFWFLMCCKCLNRRYRNNK